MADLATWVDQLMSRPEDASKIAEAVLASSGESALSLALSECCRRPWVAAPSARCALIALVEKLLLPECQHTAHLDALTHWWMGPKDNRAWAKTWLLACLRRDLPLTTQVAEVISHVATAATYWSETFGFSFGKLNIILQDKVPAGCKAAEFVAAYFAGLAVTGIVEKKFGQQDKLNENVRFLCIGLRSATVAAFVRRELPHVASPMFSDVAAGLLHRTSAHLATSFLEALNDPCFQRNMCHQYCLVLLSEEARNTLPAVCKEAWDEPTAYDALPPWSITRHTGMDCLDILDTMLPSDCTSRLVGAQVTLAVIVHVNSRALRAFKLDTASLGRLVRVLDRLSPVMQAACVARLVKRVRDEPSCMSQEVQWSLSQLVARMFVAAEDKSIMLMWKEVFRLDVTKMATCILENLVCKEGAVELQESDIRVMGVCVRMLLAVDDNFNYVAMGTVVEKLCTYGIGSKHWTDGAALTSLLLCEWRDLLCLFVRNQRDYYIMDYVLKPLLQLVVKFSLPSVWSATLIMQGDTARADVLSQIQTLTALFRVSLLHSTIYLEQLHVAVDSLCVHVIAWQQLAAPAARGCAAQAVRVCLDLLGALHMDRGTVGCSGMLSSALMRMCGTLVIAEDAEADPDTLVTALLCLSFAHDGALGAMTEHVPGLVEKALERYGTRPQCLAACAACVEWLCKRLRGDCVHPLLDRCVTLALAREEGWAPDIGWLAPVLRLFDRWVQCEMDVDMAMWKGHQKVGFALWLLDSMRVDVTASDAVVLQRIAFAALDAVAHPLYQDPRAALMTALRFVVRSVSGTPSRQVLGTQYRFWNENPVPGSRKSLVKCWTWCTQPWLQTFVPDTEATHYVPDRVKTWTSDDLRVIVCATRVLLMTQQLTFYHVLPSTVPPSSTSCVEHLLALARHVAHEVWVSDDNPKEVLRLYDTLQDIRRMFDRTEVMCERAVGRTLTDVGVLYTGAARRWSLLRGAWCGAVARVQAHRDNSASARKENAVPRVPN